LIDLEEEPSESIMSSPIKPENLEIEIIRSPIARSQPNSVPELDNNSVASSTPYNTANQNSADSSSECPVLSIESISAFTDKLNEKL